MGIYPFRPRLRIKVLLRNVFWDFCVYLEKYLKGAFWLGKVQEWWFWGICFMGFSGFWISGEGFSDILWFWSNINSVPLIVWRKFWMIKNWIWWFSGILGCGFLIFFGLDQLLFQGMWYFLEVFFFFLDDQEHNLVILRGFDYWVLLGFGFSEVGFWYFVA